MKTITFSLIAILQSFAAHSEQPKSQEPIRILLNDWTSQLILARVTGAIFSAQGYRVKYPQSNTNEQWGALSYGIDHVQIEVWEGTMAQMFERVVKSGRVVDAGSHDAKTREDWWYPLYVEQQCPGLPNWQALKECAPLFADEPGSKTGRYIAGPWEKPESARIRALGLDFKIDAVSKAEDLWLELEGAHQANKPIILFNWTPNWVEAVYPGRFIEFPEYHPDCETDPQWGINQQYHHDCGNPKNGWLKKAAWAGMKKRWPCAFETLVNINFDNNTIATVAAWVDHDKMSYQQAADRWLKENKTLWQSWIPDTCKAEGS